MNESPLLSDPAEGGEEEDGRQQERGVPSPEAGGGFVGWTDKASRSGRGVSGGLGALSGGANGGSRMGCRPARWWMPESRRWERGGKARRRGLG